MWSASCEYGPAHQIRSKATAFAFDEVLQQEQPPQQQFSSVAEPPERSQEQRASLLETLLAQPLI